jgi:hypothetical protein
MRTSIFHTHAGERAIGSHSFSQRNMMLLTAHHIAVVKANGALLNQNLNFFPEHRLPYVKFHSTHIFISIGVRLKKLSKARMGKPIKRPEVLYQLIFIFDMRKEVVEWE